MNKFLQIVLGIIAGCLVTVVVSLIALPILEKEDVPKKPDQKEELVKVEAQPLEDVMVQVDDTNSVMSEEDGNGDKQTVSGMESSSTDRADSLAEKNDVDIVVAEPTPEPTPQPDIVTITVSAAGDCSLGNHHLQDYALSFNQEYDKAEDEGYFFQNVKDIFAEDDFTIVNLEGVLTTSDKLVEGRTYNIKGDPSYAKILTAGSVEAVSMANNHRLDYGEAGTKDTVAALEAENIAYAYDKIVHVYETKGIRIGYLSVNEVAWGYGTETLVKDAIDKLKEEGVDLIIACCHWGIEKEYYPEAYQRKLGLKCIDMGADLVLGHHPHVLQGIEEYNGKYIVYSLGNFSFGANRNPADKDTMIFQQTFTFVDGELQADLNAKVIPCSVSSVKERNNFQPTPLEGEESAAVIERLNTYSVGMGVEIGEDGTLLPGVRDESAIKYAEVTQE